MIVSAANRDTSILTDLRETLSQIKPDGVTNKALVIDYPLTFCDDLPDLTEEDLAGLTLDQLAAMTNTKNGPACIVDFYADEAKQQLVFSDSTDDGDPYLGGVGTFVSDANKTFYTPPDSLINESDGISDYESQQIYWVTATFCDGTVINLVYRNLDNLLFQQVIVSSKPSVQFATNDNIAVIVPMPQDIDRMQVSGDISRATVRYDVYLQLLVYNWERLSEEQRENKRTEANNLIQNALYADRTRGGNCTFRDKNLDGTYVSALTLLPSDAVLKGRLTIQCCYFVSSLTQ